MFVNVDSGCYKAANSDMALTGNLSADDTLGTGGSAGHTYLDGSCCDMPPLSPDSTQIAGSGPDPGPLYVS